jgi:hypothetical protein
VLRHPQSIPNWKNAVLLQHGNPLAMLGISLVLFPKLALGLSGFETGVVVMPLIKGETVTIRVRNTRKLLVTASIIMGLFLLATSTATTLPIEPDKFKEGGVSNNRASYHAGSFLSQIASPFPDSLLLNRCRFLNQRSRSLRICFPVKANDC